MTEKIYDIIPFKKVPDRFIIVDLNGKLLDDAQGYGYKSILNAHKAATYKFCGGKDKSDAMKKIAKKFWLYEDLPLSGPLAQTAPQPGKEFDY